jgi:anti-sigma B factor antagonist
MTISERTTGEVTILDVDGRLTLDDGVERMRDKIRSLLLQGRTSQLINLAGVPYIDSAGLGSLVEGHGEVARRGGALKLLNATARLQDLLVITKLATIFEMHDTEAAAVASFGAAV